MGNGKAERGFCLEDRVIVSFARWGFYVLLEDGWAGIVNGHAVHILRRKTFVCPHLVVSDPSSSYASTHFSNLFPPLLRPAEIIPRRRFALVFQDTRYPNAAINIWAIC